ncbi:MAG: hypothetical protein ACYTG0_44910 [Planctomycetota bacterium]|jgi:hypothetical protein
MWFAASGKPREYQDTHDPTDRRTFVFAEGTVPAQHRHDRRRYIQFGRFTRESGAGGHDLDDVANDATLELPVGECRTAVFAGKTVTFVGRRGLCESGCRRESSIPGQDSDIAERDEQRCDHLRRRPSLQAGRRPTGLAAIINGVRIFLADTRPVATLTTDEKFPLVHAALTRDALLCSSDPAQPLLDLQRFTFPVSRADGFRWCLAE